MRKSKKRSRAELPRSVLSYMNEPLIDPRDGHGARSPSDVLLSKWKLAMKRDRDAIIELVNLAGAHSQQKLKQARNTCVVTPCGVQRFELRALAPAMTAIGIAKVEEIEVHPNATDSAL